MLLMEPTETPYDLRWTMFGIPVRVHPMFWLIAALMGNSALQLGVEYLLVWMACMFVSILVHELGHVFMGAAYGSHGHIVLYGFGGLAIGSNRLYRRGQRIAVSFAGPAAGFAFLALLFAVLWVLNSSAAWAYFLPLQMTLGFPMSNEPDVIAALRDIMADRPLMFSAINNLIFINVVWGLLNLLPIWPLDGGQISREVCEGTVGRGGLRVSLIISIAVAAALAVNSILSMYGTPILPWRFGSGYTAFLFGLLAFQSYQMLSQVNAESRWMDEHWRR